MPFVHNRVGHVAVTWNELTLIWGGYNSCSDDDDSSTSKYWDPGTVYYHFEGRWIQRKTAGDVPSATSGATAQVCLDVMYVLCGFRRQSGEGGVEANTNEVFGLDLNTWTWTKHTPVGQAPLKVDKLSSWSYDGGIYIFGGFGLAPDESTRYPNYLRFRQEGTIFQDVPARGWSNQIVRYDIARDRWDWPLCVASNVVPCPRAAQTTIICGSDVFLFGGRLGRERMNDLHHLDMKTMRWNVVHGKHTGKAFPTGRSWHSLTWISDRGAILFGGYDARSAPLGDCWFLDTKACREADDTRKNNDLWTRCKHHEKDPGIHGSARLWHQAVKEPTSNRVWVMGGVVSDIMRAAEHPIDMVVMAFSSDQTLKLLAMESVVKNYNRGDINSSELPETLRQELRVRFANHAEVKDLQAPRDL